MTFLIPNCLPSSRPLLSVLCLSLQFPYLPLPSSLSHLSHPGLGAALPYAALVPIPGPLSFPCHLENWALLHLTGSFTLPAHCFRFTSVGLFSLTSLTFPILLLFFLPNTSPSEFTLFSSLSFPLE